MYYFIKLHRRPTGHLPTLTTPSSIVWQWKSSRGRDRTLWTRTQEDPLSFPNRSNSPCSILSLWFHPAFFSHIPCRLWAWFSRRSSGWQLARWQELAESESNSRMVWLVCRRSFEAAECEALWNPSIYRGSGSTRRLRNTRHSHTWRLRRRYWSDLWSGQGHESPRIQHQSKSEQGR